MDREVSPFRFQRPSLAGAIQISHSMHATEVNMENNVGKKKV